MNGNLYEERGEDRRIRKSKKALQEALIRLLSKKSIGEITIKELTDEADVHRGTFYHHYADAMDLKVQTEREIAEQLGGGRDADGARRDGTHHGADDGQPKPDRDEPIRIHTIE